VTPDTFWSFKSSPSWLISHDCPQHEGEAEDKDQEDQGTKSNPEVDQLGEQFKAAILAWLCSNANHLSLKVLYSPPTKRTTTAVNSN
jgi:hypothetical protein